MAVLALGAQAQIINIMKNGRVVASYPASSVDEVVFSPAAYLTPAEAIAGTYGDAVLSVTLLEMPSMGTVLCEEREFSIIATGDAQITLNLPSVYYEAMDMDLPAITVEGIEVIDDGFGTYTIEAEYATEADGKSIKCAISGSFEPATGTYALTNNLNYGSMPFTLSMQYCPLAITE